MTHDIFVRKISEQERAFSRVRAEKVAKTNKERNKQMQLQCVDGM